MRDAREVRRIPGNPIPTIAVLLACITTPSGLGAQQSPCTESMTLVDCYTAYREQAVLRGELGKLEGTTTGMGAAGFSSALSDFLPFLAGSLGLNPVATDEEGAFAFETNFGVGLGTGARQKIRVRTTLRKGMLYAPLKQALPVSIREEKAATIQNGFGDFDDVELALAWNLESRSNGRTFANQQAVYGRLVGEVLGPATSSAAVRIGQQLTSLGPALADCPAEPTVGCIPGESRAEMLENLQTLAEEDLALSDSAGVLLREAGLDRFADLVNNQPQFSMDATLRLQDELVGPGSFAIGVRYERGFDNMNGLRAACEDGGSPVVTLDCLQDYLNRPGVESSLDTGNRVWAAAHFSRVDAFAANLLVDSARVDIGESWDLIFEAGYGRYLQVDAQGNQLGRLDVSVEGRLVDAQTENRENRFVFRFDLSRQISEGVTMVFGVSAATRPEFINEEARKFRVRTGLRYGLH